MRWIDGWAIVWLNGRLYSITANYCEIIGSKMISDVMISTGR